MAPKRSVMVLLAALVLVLFLAAAGGFLAFTGAADGRLALHTGSENLHAWVFGVGRPYPPAAERAAKAAAVSAEVRGPMALVDLFG